MDLDETRGTADARGYRPGDRVPKVDRGDMNRRGMKKSDTGAPFWFMPPAIKQLFDPRPALDPKLPMNVAEPGKPSSLTGISSFLGQLDEGPAPRRPEALDQHSSAARRKAARLAAAKEIVAQNAMSWDPAKDSKATADAFSTLFVARLAHNTSEETLKKVFGDFGPIVQLRIVRDSSGKSRGYGFIQYEDEEDVKKAYRRGEGVVIDGHRVVLDVERGRTVRGWIPRRLGGGLGTSRDTRPTSKRDKKAERIYPTVGQFCVIVPPELESRTRGEAVKARYIMLADIRVRANREAMARAAAEKAGPAAVGAQAPRAAPAAGNRPPPPAAVDGGYSRSGLGLGYGRGGVSADNSGSGGQWERAKMDDRDRPRYPQTEDRGRDGGRDRERERRADDRYERRDRPEEDRDRERTRGSGGVSSDRDRYGGRDGRSRSRSRDRERRRDDRDRSRSRGRY